MQINAKISWNFLESALTSTNFSESYKNSAVLTTFPSAHPANGDRIRLANPLILRCDWNKNTSRLPANRRCSGAMSRRRVVIIVKKSSWKFISIPTCLRRLSGDSLSDGSRSPTTRTRARCDKTKNFRCQRDEAFTPCHLVSGWRRAFYHAHITLSNFVAPTKSHKVFFRHINSDIESASATWRRGERALSSQILILWKWTAEKHTQESGKQAFRGGGKTF